MDQSTATYPNITHSLDKLNILVFWGILKENNPLLLDPDYSDHKNYTEEERSYIVQTWQLMYDSYFQVKNDSKSKVVLHNACQLMLLGYRIHMLEYNLRWVGHLEETKHLFTQESIQDKEQILLRGFKTLEPDLNIQFFKSVEFNLDAVNKRLDALRNKYNREKLDNDKAVSEQVDNVFSVIVKVSRRLNMHLNAHKLSVNEWLAYEQEARDMQKAEELARRK